MRRERNRTDERIYKKNAKRKLASQSRGITLVALVITIIIIIILATVTINMAFGDDGIIKRAELAKDMYANDTAYTDQSMANATAYLDEMLNGVAGGSGTDEGGDEPETPEIPSEWDQTIVTPVLSDDNQWVPVPKGFTASTVEGEKRVNDGFVIKQGSNGGATSGVNEFVWIPVDDESLAEMYNTENPGTELSKSTLNEVTTTTDVYSKLRVREGDSYTAGTPNSTNVREPDILPDTSYGDAVTRNISMGVEQIKSVLGITGATDAEVLKNYAQSLVEEYTAMYDSVARYDGFYIGRYELTGTVESPTVQKGEKVLASQNWYNLKKACTNLVQAGENTGAQSEMIYGNQWDEVMDWIVDTGDKTAEQINEDSSSWGNYKDYNTANGYEEGNEKYVAEAGTGVLAAGSSEYWKANNIYDLAGNAFDWTQEAYNTYYRINRGGVYTSSGSSYPASDRNNSRPSNSGSDRSSRPALYVALNADQT